MKETLQRLSRFIVIPPMVAMVLFPSSQNYQLKSYEFGGGGGTAASENYTQEGIVGEQATTDQASENFRIGSGLNVVQQANVPTVTITNDANWYNKLKVIIGIENNPTDTVYAIAISSDDFVTTNYVQSDNTVSTTKTTTILQAIRRIVRMQVFCRILLFFFY